MERRVTGERLPLNKGSRYYGDCGPLPLLILLSIEDSMTA
jgi:hypothetical protein